MSPAPERLAEIRAWAAGSHAARSLRIPSDTWSFTPDLLAEIDALTAELNELRRVVKLATETFMVLSKCDELFRKLDSETP